MEGHVEQSTPSSPLSCSPSTSIASSTSLFGFEPEGKVDKGKERTPTPDTEKGTKGDGVEKADNAAYAECGQRSHGRKEDEHEFNPERYLLWHKRVLLHRARVGPGRSHEMQRLFNFWLTFLIDNFNDAMYQAFKRYAEEDASAGHTFGLTCLFHFFCRYLSQDFESEIYQDFEMLALKYQDYLDYEEGIDCLCHFLAGASAHSQPPGAGRHTRSPSSSSGTPPTATSTSASVASSSSSGGMLLLPPGLPRDSGVEVDSRVLEQLQAWHRVRAAAQLCSHQPDCNRNGSVQSDGPPALSMTGSSEAGGDGDGSGAMNAAQAMVLPKRLGRRPNGKLVQAMRRASARCSSPPSAQCLGSSPPAAHAAGSAPSASDRYMASVPAAGKGGAATTAAPPTGPPGTRPKRARQPKFAGTGRRGGSGGAGSGLTGTSPPFRASPAPAQANGGRPLRVHAPSYPYTNEELKLALQSGRGADGGFSSAPNSGPGRARGRGSAGADTGAGGGAGDVPLWEAQPCGVTCGAAAEIAKALPMRLGELFGD